MHTKIASDILLLQFKHLPAYANYLLTERLQDYSLQILQLIRQYNVLLLRQFDNVEEKEIQRINQQGIEDFLSQLAKNDVRRQIDATINKWSQNLLPKVDKYAIQAEDITLISFIRKQSFLFFLKDYTKDAAEIIEIIKEIDELMLVYESALTNNYIALLRNHINEQLYLIQKINNTSPGVIYVFNIKTLSVQFANQASKEFIGLSTEELIGLGSNVVQQVMPAADIKKIMEVIEGIKNLKDGEVRQLEQRLRNNKGKYCWMRNYISVFKRDADGNVEEIIGILQDVDEEKRAQLQLQEREQQLLEAQNIAQVGSFIWDLKNNKASRGTTKAKEILEIELNEGESFFNNVVDSDRDKLNKAIEAAYKSGQLECEYRYKGKENEKVLWVKGVVNYDNGQPACITGTIMDVTERHHMLEELKRRENTYKQSEALANMGNYIVNLKTNEVEWTDQLYIIYGLQPQSEKMTIERFFSFIHPDDKERVEQTIEQFYKAGITDYKFRITTQTGETKILHTIAQLQKDEQGNNLYVIGTEQDVTEQERLIQQFEESERLYKQAQAIAKMGNWRYQLAENKITWSDEMYSIYELDKSTHIDLELVFSFVHPDERDEARTYFDKCIQEKTPYDKRYRIVLANGKIKTLQRKAEMKLDEEGNVAEVLGTTQDITEQIEATNTIKEQEYFINQIADSSPTVLYLYDVPSQSIAYINKEIYYVLGYTIDEIMDTSNRVTQLLYHKDDIELLPERLDSPRKFHHTDSMIQYECRMKNKDGDWCWLLVREVVFKKEGDKIVQILGSALDISKRKEIEKSLLQKSFLLEQSNASLEEFAYVASHDLKEPLRKISTFGDRLVTTQLERMSDDGKIYLKKIVDASQRMQTMITDLLSISMISGDRSFQPYSLQAILTEVLQTLEYKIEQKAAIITSDPLPEANIVPSQIRQLFQNLISNSLKFVKENKQPKINISYTSVQPQELHHLQLAKAPFYHKLEFSDNGIGFEEEYAGKIFAIFQRLHGRSEYEGTGIGLAICKKIVEHHGGVIYATGVPDEGATFTIILPA